MLGAMIGDIAGSVYEFRNVKHKFFPFWSEYCHMTDDSYMTLAVAKAILDSRATGKPLEECAFRWMQVIGNKYPRAGYGGGFQRWLLSSDPKPYGSYGNGAAMRVSPCGFAAKSPEEAKALSAAVTAVTHNHPEGMKGAEAATVAIWMARNGSTKEEIREKINAEYYPMNFTLDGIRDSYYFNETCQNTVPQALMAFFESTDYEDAIRNAISIGGDSDTLAAITGGVAQAFYGVPEELREKAMEYMDEYTRAIFDEFEKNCM